MFDLECYPRTASLKMTFKSTKDLIRVSLTRRVFQNSEAVLNNPRKSCNKVLEEDSNHFEL